MGLSPRVRPVARGSRSLAPEENLAVAERRCTARAFLFCLWSVGDERIARQLCTSALAHADLQDPFGRVHVARAQMIRALRRKRIALALPADSQFLAAVIAKTLKLAMRTRKAPRSAAVVIGVIARQPLAFRDALILSLLFGFSTAETADALALPFPRANALINEAKVRLNLERLRLSSGRGTSAAEDPESFENGLAELRRLTQCYIDSKAMRQPPRSGWKERLFKSLRPLLSVCVTTAWFAAPVSAVIALTQCLLVHTFDDEPNVLETSAPAGHRAPVHRVLFEGAFRI
jgi:hypothetical protein